MSESEGSDAGAPTTETVYAVGVETEVPLTDGKLFKTVLVEGTGQAPPRGAKVSVHYVGTLASDNSTFDSSRDRGEAFEFTLGQGQVIKGWDSGVATMKIGEKSILRCLPEYAYGKNGSPPKIPADATLNFEVELLSWTKEEDVSEARDKSIMKRIDTEGAGYDHPDYESAVTVSVTVSVRGSVTLRKDDWTFTVGDAELPVGLEKVLCSMKKGEKCEATVSGRVVLSNDEAHGIVAGQDVVYVVSLADFKAVKTWEFKGAEKVEQGAKRKDQGNAFFAAGDWSRAIRKYKRGLEFVEYDYGLEGDVKKDASKLKVALLSNFAQALINMREYKEAITQCNKGLETESSNVKLLFRRGKASALLDEWDDAKRDMRKIIDLEPTNADAARELAAVEAKERQYDQQMKARYSRLFA